jgi:hypothetical protein
VKLSPGSSRTFDRSMPEGARDCSRHARPRRDEGDAASAARSATHRIAARDQAIEAHAFSDIDYYLLRARAELRLIRASPRREVALIHFKLANAYLQCISDLVRMAAGQPSQGRADGYPASRGSTGRHAVAGSN